MQTVDVNGTQVEAFFASGQSIYIGVGRDREYLDDSGSPEARLMWPHGDDNGIEYAITGGADGDLFILHNEFLYLKLDLPLTTQQMQMVITDMKLN